MITIFTQSVRLYVRPSQNFKIKQQSLPAGTVGWPSGSLMTPVLFLDVNVFDIITTVQYCKPYLVIKCDFLVIQSIHHEVDQWCWPTSDHFARNVAGFSDLHLANLDEAAFDLLCDNDIHCE